MTRASVATIERSLASLRAAAEGEHSGLRTNVVDLVVFCGTREIGDEAASAVENLPSNRPSRAIVLEPGDGDEVRSLESVFCAMPADSAATLVCSEVVRLSGPVDTGALASMTASLLLPDLPVFLLWLDEPDWERPLYQALAAMVSRVVMDSTRFPETIDTLPQLVSDAPPYVTDLAWTKVTGWREVVAQLFDPPANRALLAGLERVRVRYIAGSDAQARLLAGWLRSRTGRVIEEDLAAVHRDDMRPGSLVEIDLVCADGDLTIERPTEGLAVTHSPGLADQRLALRVPPFATLVGDELECLARDRVFEAALQATADPTHAG